MFSIHLLLRLLEDSLAPPVPPASRLVETQGRDAVAVICQKCQMAWMSRTGTCLSMLWNVKLWNENGVTSANLFLSWDPMINRIWLVSYTNLTELECSKLRYTHPILLWSPRYTYYENNCSNLAIIYNAYLLPSCQVYFNCFNETGLRFSFCFSDTVIMALVLQYLNNMQVYMDKYGGKESWYKTLVIWIIIVQTNGSLPLSMWFQDYIIIVYSWFLHTINSIQTNSQTKYLYRYSKATIRTKCLIILLFSCYLC